MIIVRYALQKPDRGEAQKRCRRRGGRSGAVATNHGESAVVASAVEFACAPPSPVMDLVGALRCDEHGSVALADVGEPMWP